MSKYFSPNLRVFWETNSELCSCPISGERVIPINTVEFFNEFQKRCPITFELIEKGDQLITVYDNEKKIFIEKPLKNKISLPEPEGELVVNGTTIKLFYTTDQYNKIKKSYESRVFVLKENGSYYQKEY